MSGWGECVPYFHCKLAFLSCIADLWLSECILVLGVSSACPRSKVSARPLVCVLVLGVVSQKRVLGQRSPPLPGVCWCSALTEQ